MIKLTDEEAWKIPSAKLYIYSRPRMILMDIKVGKIMLLEKSDWLQKKKNPGELVRRLRKSGKMDFSIEIVLDNLGWIIKRLK